MKSLTSPFKYIWDSLKWAPVPLSDKGVRKQRNKSAWELCIEKNFECGIGKWKQLEAEFRCPKFFFLSYDLKIQESWWKRKILTVEAQNFPWAPKLPKVKGRF